MTAQEYLSNPENVSILVLDNLEDNDGRPLLSGLLADMLSEHFRAKKSAAQPEAKAWDFCLAVEAIAKYYLHEGSKTEQVGCRIYPMVPYDGSGDLRRVGKENHCPPLGAA